MPLNADPAAPPASAAVAAASPCTNSVAGPQHANAQTTGASGHSGGTSDSDVEVLLAGWVYKEVGVRFTRWRRRFCVLRTATPEEQEATAKSKSQSAAAHGSDHVTHFLLFYKRDSDVATATPTSAHTVSRCHTTVAETFKRVNRRTQRCVLIRSPRSRPVCLLPDPADGDSSTESTLSTTTTTAATSTQRYIRILSGLEAPANAADLRRNTLGTARVVAVRPMDEPDPDRGPGPDVTAGDVDPRDTGHEQGHSLDAAAMILDDGGDGLDRAVCTPHASTACDPSSAAVTALAPELQSWASTFPETFRVWEGLHLPSSWAAVLCGLQRLVRMLGESDDKLGTHTVKQALFRTVAHCDIFFSGRLDPAVYGNPTADCTIEVPPGRMASGARKARTGGEISVPEFLEQLQASAAVPLETLPAELHAYDQFHLDGRPPIVDNQGYVVEEATNPLFKVKQGHTQAAHVPYLQPQFDPVARALLDDPAWAERIGSSDPLRVLLTMLAVHSEYVHIMLTELYPDGLGAAHGAALSALPKGLDRMRVKATGDYEGVGVAPNRPGENWQKLHALKAGGKRREGAIGDALYDAPPLPDVQYARAATSTACLLDTVRRSVTTATLASQEAFLDELVQDASRWELLRVKSTLADPLSTVKQCLVNMAFSAPSTAVRDDAADARQFANASSAGHSQQTYSEMTASASFALAVERVQQRNSVGDGIIAAACELLRSPQLASKPITLVVEVQLYIDYFLKQRKRVHAFYKVLRADSALALSADCAKYAAEGSAMSCSAEMLQHRAVIVTRIIGRDACYLLDTWEIDGIQVSQAADLGALLAVTTTVQRLDLDLAGQPLGPAGTAVIADSLRLNKGLIDLDLAHNEVGDAGAIALATALTANSVLSTLRLAINAIGHVGASHLAAWIAVSDTIESLLLDSNDFGDDGAEALGAAVGRNRSLRTLSLSGNAVGDRGATALARGLGFNATLTRLTLDRNGIADTGATALAMSLANNAALEELSLRVNKVGGDAAAAFTDLLRVNTTLTSLDLRVNFKITGDARRELHAAGVENTGVKLSL